MNWCLSCFVWHTVHRYGAYKTPGKPLPYINYHQGMQKTRHKQVAVDYVSGSGWWVYRWVSTRIQSKELVWGRESISHSSLWPWIRGGGRIQAGDAPSLIQHQGPSGWPLTTAHRWRSGRRWNLLARPAASSPGAVWIFSSNMFSRVFVFMKGWTKKKKKREQIENWVIHMYMSTHTHLVSGLLIRRQTTDGLSAFCPTQITVSVTQS